MSNLINIPLETMRIINYTGEMKHFGDALAEAAKEDPELEQQILFAANELKFVQYSRDKGEELIDELFKPR